MGDTVWEYTLSESLPGEGSLGSRCGNTLCGSDSKTLWGTKCPSTFNGDGPFYLVSKGDVRYVSTSGPTSPDFLGIGIGGAGLSCLVWAAWSAMTHKGDG